MAASEILQSEEKRDDVEVLHEQEESEATPNPDDEVPSITADKARAFREQLSRFRHASPAKQVASSDTIARRRPLTRSITAAAAAAQSDSSSSSSTPTSSSSIPEAVAPATPLSSLSPSPSIAHDSSTASRKRKRGSRHTEPRNPPNLLRDSIPPNLILLFVGVNPGLMTGATGYAYAHPSNLFWKLLHSSGITDIRHLPSDTYKLPELYSVGNTNIVSRPTRDASMLSKREMDEGVPILEEKIARQRPEAVALVGKSIWEAVWRVKHNGKAIGKDEFHYGWQDEKYNLGVTPDWKGARVFVATTTSGLAAGMTMSEKEAVWAELGKWVVQRRKERKEASQASSD